MKILCKTSNNNDPQPGQVINKLGKYLFKNIDSAYKIEYRPNMCDLYITVYYQLPSYERWRRKIDDNEVSEMDIDISITAYADKFRVNVIELSPNEKTLSFRTYKSVMLLHFDEARDIILKDVQSAVIKEYKDYDFIF